MEKVKQITPEFLDNFRMNMDIILKSVGEEYGLDVKLANIRYSNFEADCKLKILVREKGSVISKADEETWKTCCTGYGLSEDTLGKKFYYKGRTWTTSGMNIRSRKYPIKCTDDTGEVSRFGLEFFKRLLETNPAS